MDVALAGRDGAHGGDDLRVGGLLEHVAARARLERLAHVARVVLHREDEHLRLRARPAAAAGMPSIPLLPGITTSMQHDVGLVLDRLEDGALGVRRLADGLDVRPPRRARGGARSGRPRGRRRRGRGCVTERHLGDERRARPVGADSIAQPPADERRRARACRRSPRPSVARPPSGSKPAPSSSTTAATDVALRVSRMLTRARIRVLDDVRQRLLDDAVERRLDLGRQPLVAELRLEVDRGSRSARANVSASRSTAGTSPKSSSADGPQLDREPAHVLQRRDDELAQRARPPRALVRRSTRCSSGFSPSRIEVSACPSRRAARARARLRSSSCASTTRRTASRLTRSERSTAIAARAAERLGEPQVVVGEAGVGAGLVVRDRRRRSARPLDDRAGRRAPSGRRAGARPAGRSPDPRAPSRRARCARARARGPPSSRRTRARIPTTP